MVQHQFAGRFSWVEPALLGRPPNPGRVDGYDTLVAVGATVGTAAVVEGDFAVGCTAVWSPVWTGLFGTDENA